MLYVVVRPRCLSRLAVSEDFPHQCIHTKLVRVRAFQFSPTTSLFGRQEIALSSLVSIPSPFRVLTTHGLSPRRQLACRNQVLNEALSRLASSEPYPVDAGTAGSLSATSTASAGGGAAGFPAIPRLMDRGRELAASLGGERLCWRYSTCTYSSRLFVFVVLMVSCSLLCTFAVWAFLVPLTVCK